MQNNLQKSEIDRLYEKFRALLLKKAELSAKINDEKTRKLKIEAKKRTILDFLRIIRAIKQHTSHNTTENAINDLRNILKHSGGLSMYDEYVAQCTEYEKLQKELRFRKLLSSMTFTKNPIIFDTRKEIFAILNIGVMPTAHQTDFYNRYFIYPINYRVERVFRGYRTDHSSLLVYTCVILNKDDKVVFEIYDNNKLLVSGGKSIWKNFCDLFKMNINDVKLEDFFALTNKNVQFMIEDSVDLKRYEQYIPLRERK
ncbi:putative FY-rich [Trachipleistophora hominis]|uniref:Putative FY-rich n=1 Tax=Trachipleistophora hominis TaxID=72359 RepID=L7JTK3_TRAHO|nr:putative FY-rich [Trachipleistophora hominis]